MSCSAREFHSSWESHFSEKLISMFMVYSYKVLQSGYLLIRDLIQKPNVYPSFSLPTTILESHLLYASADGNAAPLDGERKGQGGFPDVENHPTI